MGTYATTTSIPLLLPFALKTNTTTGDTAGVDVFSKQITRAEGLVNGYIAARYSLPFSTVPPLITTITEDISCYYFIRSTYVQDGERKNEYADSFKEAIKQLEQIRDGKTPLALTSGALIPQITSGKFISSTQNYAPTFDEGNPEQWDIDPDKEDDIQSAK